MDLMLLLPLPLLPAAALEKIFNCLNRKLQLQLLPVLRIFALAVLDFLAGAFNPLRAICCNFIEFIVVAPPPPLFFASHPVQNHKIPFPFDLT